MANGMGQKFAAVSRALGILLGVWGVLAAIAFLAGVVPPESPEPELTADDDTSDGGELARAEPTAEAADTSAADGRGGHPGVAAAAHDSIGPAEGSAQGAAQGQSPEPETAPEASSARILRHASVCESVEHARVGVGSVVGNASPERVVICGRQARVFAPTAEGYARLATLTLGGEAQVRMASPVVADVDGDGLNDLVLGWTHLDAEGGPDGGTLRVVAGHPSGGFGEVDALAALSVVDLRVMELDGHPGADLVALHWADGFGRRPSEAYVFAGGPSPRRLARRRLGHDGVAVDVADVDGDGELDLITLDAEGVQVAEGDGTGRFPRFRSIPLEAGRDLVVVRSPAPTPAPTPAPAPAPSGEGQGDDAVPAPGPTADRVYVVGDTVVRLESEGEPTVLAAPHGILRALALPSGELLAMTRQRVAIVSDGSDQTIVDLPGTFRPTDIALLEGGTLLVLGRTANGWELIEAPVGEGTVRLLPGAEASRPVDAPLVLDLALH